MSLANEMILEPMGEMHDYWLEFNEIEQVKEPEVTVDGHCKAIDEGQAEAQWLTDAGFGFIVENFLGDRDMSEDELQSMMSSLTRLQSSAVLRRVQSLGHTLRRRKVCNKIHVKDIFPTPSAPDDSRCPVFQSSIEPMGATLIDNLSEKDLSKVKSLALIELTALFDSHNISYSHSKRTKNIKEHGLFGVPLQMMVRNDLKRVIGIKVPLFFEAMVDYMEKHALLVEGILRISGSVTTIKKLRQQLEERFYLGTFDWSSMLPCECAALLKQFLRELPVPLLTDIYLDAFAQVECIPSMEEKLKALNLLIILLPAVHRDVVKLLICLLKRIASNSAINKMSMSNVCMIMAPNLFYALDIKGFGGGARWEASVELKKASMTANITQLLIHHQDVLWDVSECLFSL